MAVFRHVVPLLLCIVLRAIADGEVGQCSAADGSCASTSDAADYSWEPKTLSVVLPCAGEADFAFKTVQSVSDSVPGGSGGSILSEIVVVDDGSKPPLAKTHLTPEVQQKYNVKLVRHKKAIGLMGAKSAGAAVAVGDIVVFFDCHVAPQDDWYDVFLKSSAVNYRRIVVPIITDLDIDTWKERRRSDGVAKCYLTWDVDFKWINLDQPFMPVLSGGLLGISRRWWNETGGYDDGMRGWGGENIDQSLRTWLCGGEIYSMSNAFVAHMWRTPNDPRTQVKYNVDVRQTITNKGRAALAWYGDYLEKVGEYPDMRYIGFGPGGQKPNLDVSKLHAVRDKLQCRPLQWFLWRFRHIYVDGGLLPQKTFKLKESTTGLCLTYKGPPGTHPQGRATAELGPCDGRRLQHPDGTRWHLGNKIVKTGKCCSGLRTWNTDQCLAGPSSPNGPFANIVTNVCDVSGMQRQDWRFVEKHKTLMPGQIMFRTACLVVKDKQLGFEKCRPLSDGERGPWSRIDLEVPVETKLYKKALEEQPDLFK